MRSRDYLHLHVYAAYKKETLKEGEVYRDFMIY